MRAKYDRGEDVTGNPQQQGGGGFPGAQHFFHRQGGQPGGQHHNFHFRH
jgi:hypothetical protein